MRSRRLLHGSWVAVPIFIAVDQNKHEANDFGSLGLKNKIELFDAVKEGAIKSEHEFINNNHREPEILEKKLLEFERKISEAWQKRTRIRKS